MITSNPYFPQSSKFHENQQQILPDFCLYAAAAAKSLQSLSDSVRPHRRQPTKLPHPWDSPGKHTGVGCISLSSAWKWKVKVKLLSHFRLLATPWTVAYQAHPSMGFSRQEYWFGVPLPSPSAHISLSKNIFFKELKIGRKNIH